MKTRSFLGWCLRTIWKHLRRSVRSHRIDSAVGPILSALSDSEELVTFVQVGSNDGKSNDPLHPYIRASRWRGILVEPVPYLFDRLRRTYESADAEERLTFVQAAVTTALGEMEFHHVRECNDAALPAWYDQIGSFSRESLLRYRRVIPDIESRLVTVKVPCTTVAELTRTHGLQRLDLLQIDTEGHDFEVLSSVDFEMNRPRIVIYEHKHLSGPTRRAGLRLLHSHGYETVVGRVDTIALDRHSFLPGSPVSGVWESLGQL